MRAEKSTDNTGFTISSNKSEEEATKLNSNTVNPRNSNFLKKLNSWTLLNYDKINNCFNFTVGSSTRYEEEISRVDEFIQASRRTTISNVKMYEGIDLMQFNEHIMNKYVNKLITVLYTPKELQKA